MNMKVSRLPAIQAESPGFFQADYPVAFRITLKI